MPKYVINIDEVRDMTDKEKNDFMDNTRHANVFSGITGNSEYTVTKRVIMCELEDNEYRAVKKALVDVL